MKHFISLLDYSHEDLLAILDRADILAKDWAEHNTPQILQNKQVGLWFYGNGFRNRLAFEIGAKAMGGSVSYIPAELGVNEPLEDIGPYLQNWYDLLVIRAKSHAELTYLANHIEIPLINARTDFSHPCEIMGDLQFIRKYRGTLDNLNVVFVGEVTNLCMSWFEAAVRFPITVTQIAPNGYEASTDLIKKLNLNSIGHIKTSDDLGLLNKTTDLLYTDCWPRAEDYDQKQRIKKLFLPYQITSQHLSRLNTSAIFLPCPPVTRGEEVSIDAMNSKLCLNYKAKKYLLHSQNAIMEMVSVCY